MTRWQDRFPWTAAMIGYFWPDGPARRKRWLKIAIAVTLVVAAHAGLTVFTAARTSRVADRFVARWGSLDVASLGPASVEDAANAARAVRAATELMVLPSTRVGANARIHEKFASGDANDLTAADRDAIRSVVRDNALALSILDKAAARTGSDWGLHYEWGIETDVPPMLRIIQLAKLNAASGRLAVEDDRVDDAVTALRRGESIARSLEGEPILIVQLIRLAVTRLDAGLARCILGRSILSPEQLATISSLISDDTPRLKTQQAMIAEAKMIDGVFGGRTGAAGFATRQLRLESALSFGVVRAVARPFLLEEERVWLEIMEGRIAELDVPRHARPGTDKGPELRSWDVLVRIVVSNLDGVADRADLAETRYRLARAAIAIERYRAERGRAPGTLAELVPAHPPESPVDPLTGRPFAYASDGATWRIWSEADWRSIESARMHDPVLDWSRPLRPPARGLPRRRAPPRR